MARPKKARPRVWFDLDYSYSDSERRPNPTLLIRCEGYSALTLQARINIKHNWVSHLATTGCPEPLTDLVAASKLFAKMIPFAGPIPDDASIIMIYYANHISSFDFEIPTADIMRVTPLLQNAMDHAREILARNSESAGTHSNSEEAYVN